MQAASYFDKQQVILTNSKLFWQAASNFDKQQVILTSSKLIYKQQVILTNSKLFNKQWVIYAKSKLQPTNKLQPRNSGYLSFEPYTRLTSYKT